MGNCCLRANVKSGSSLKDPLLGDSGSFLDFRDGGGTSLNTGGAGMVARPAGEAAPAPPPPPATSPEKKKWHNCCSCGTVTHYGVLMYTRCAACCLGYCPHCGEQIGGPQDAVCNACGTALILSGTIGAPQAACGTGTAALNILSNHRPEGDGGGGGGGGGGSDGEGGGVGGSGGGGSDGEEEDDGKDDNEGRGSVRGSVGGGGGGGGEGGGEGGGGRDGDDNSSSGQASLGEGETACGAHGSKPPPGAAAGGSGGSATARGVDEAGRPLRVQFVGVAPPEPPTRRSMSGGSIAGDDVMGAISLDSGNVGVSQGLSRKDTPKDLKSLITGGDAVRDDTPHVSARKSTGGAGLIELA